MNTGQEEDAKWELVKDSCLQEGPITTGGVLPVDHFITQASSFQLYLLTRTFLRGLNFFSDDNIFFLQNTVL